uniref:Pyrin domain-containing protein n=1 Tax=Cyclopterus lumpus TaxID=8103 RepID=A0A8C3AFS8_CYCLU
MGYIWKTLENLSEKQFKEFKWFLKLEGNAEGFSAIREAGLEKADGQDTVDLMVQKYGCSRALEITMSILEEINRNDLNYWSNWLEGKLQTKNQRKRVRRVTSDLPVSQGRI